MAPAAPVIILLSPEAAALLAGATAVAATQIAQNSEALATAIGEGIEKGKEAISEAADAVINAIDEAMSDDAVEACENCEESKSKEEEKTRESEKEKDRPAKSKDDIDRGRQNNHIEGTNEHKVRSQSEAKGNQSTWKDGAKADELTLEAYDKGTVTQRWPDGSVKEVKWDSGSANPVGAQGQTQITVKAKPGNGKIHGFPSGPRSTP